MRSATAWSCAWTSSNLRSRAALEPRDDVLARDLEAERGKLGDDGVRHGAAVALGERGRAGGVLDDRAGQLARAQARAPPREAGQRRLAAVGQRPSAGPLLDPH